MDVCRTFPAASQKVHGLEKSFCTRQTETQEVDRKPNESEVNPHGAETQIRVVKKTRFVPNGCLLLGRR